MMKNCQLQENNLRKKKEKGEKKKRKKSVFHDGINLLSFNFLLLQFNGLGRRK